MARPAFASRAQRSQDGTKEMTLSTQLDAIRSGEPACHALAFVDLNASMVLANSAAASAGQEHWDALCQVAKQLLDGTAVAGDDDNPPVTNAIVLDPDEVTIFARSSSAPEDALCAVCSTQVEVCAILAKMQALLGELDSDP